LLLSEFNRGRAFKNGETICPEVCDSLVCPHGHFIIWAAPITMQVRELQTAVDLPEQRVGEPRAFRGGLDRHVGIVAINIYSSHFKEEDQTLFPQERY